MNRLPYGWLLVIALILPLLAACASAPQVATEEVAAPESDTVAEETTEDVPEDTAEVAYPTEAINIMAPASPGGGWDSTARAMQAALQAVTDVNAQVYNVSGAGGTVGLAQFVNDHAGDPHQLMVGGLVMVGAIQTNNAPVTLDQVTPIAALTSEAEAIAVPADSEYETLQQLIDDFAADPTSISWGGGSAGGTDHILVGLIAKEVGVDPSQINYIAHSGGGEALAAILSGAVTAGVSGVSEFRDQVEAGEMRILAVSGAEPVEGVDAPTLQEAGVDVVLPNWRAVFAPPELTDEERAAIIATIEELHASPEWQEALEANGWEDFFVAGDEFATYLNEQRASIETVLQDIGLTE